MNRNYIETTENGRIIGVHNLSLDAYNLNKDAKTLIEGSADPDIHYIKDGQITERPLQQTKLDGLTLTDLPVPCTILINGTPYERDSDTAELEFDQPTSYEIRVESWPYQEWSTTYENQT